MCCDGECRPLGFLLGLPFAFLALILSVIGVIIWIVGYAVFFLPLGFIIDFWVSDYCHSGTISDPIELLLTLICPCCLCVTIIVELALGLIKAPIHVMKWFTEQIPC